MVGDLKDSAADERQQRQTAVIGLTGALSPTLIYGSTRHDHPRPFRSRILRCATLRTTNAGLKGIFTMKCQVTVFSFHCSDDSCGGERSSTLQTVTCVAAGTNRHQQKGKTNGRP